MSQVSQIHAFGSNRTPIVADTYNPEADGSVWTIVVCPGYGSIKGLMAPWGEALAAQGHTACVVGYRGYGDVTGQMGRIFPAEHVDDVRGIVRWVKAQQADRPARVALLGVSYGGAIAIETGGLEAGVDAVISIVGYGSGARHLRAARRYNEWLPFLDRIVGDRLTRSVSGRSEPISLDEILLRDPDAAEWRRRVEEEHPEMRFDLTVESVDKLLEFRPEERLPYLSGVPLLIIHAERDHMIPLSEADKLFERATDPKRLVVIPSIDHHDVHHGEAFERCIDETTRFLSEAPTPRRSRPLEP